MCVHVSFACRFLKVKQQQFFIHQKTFQKPFIDKQKVPEEASAPFAGMKLKKSTPVQRKPVEHKLESVQLKHHEFEAKPQVEEVTTTVNKHVTKTLTFQPY
jgi:hypothetical protein